MIRLVAPFTTDDRVTIVEGDATREAPVEEYDTIWHDIWPSPGPEFNDERRIVEAYYDFWLRPGGWKGVWGQCTS